MPYVRTGQRKVLNRRKRSRSAPAVLITPAAKRTKRKQWTEYQMEAAMGAVKSGKSGINRAAIDHGNHNEYPLLYKEAEISTSSLGKFLECRKCYILLVTCALVIYLICMPSGFGHTYQANPSCPCYNYYMSVACALLIMKTMFLKVAEQIGYIVDAEGGYMKIVSKML